MNNCPVCGKANKPIATVCEECGTALEMNKVDFDADQASLDSAIKAPGAPSAPGMPGSPAAQGAPTPPKPGAPPAPPKAPGA